MKIALMADSHNNWDNLSLAITIANQDDCSALLFAGDLVVPAGVERLAQFDGPVHFIVGNNEKKVSEIEEKTEAFDNVHFYGEEYDGEISGVRVYMHHYPKKARQAALNEEYDLCIYGHTHEFDIDRADEALLVNPGVLQGPRGRVGFAIYDSKKDSVEEIGLAY